MQFSKTEFDNFVSQISAIYGKNEANSIAFLFFAENFGLSKTDILTNKSLPNYFDFSTIITRLQAHEPIQYIIGYADFFGLKFEVNEHTLIPRNETEELVNLAVNWLKLNTHQKPNLEVLDMGTGTGCIAISIAKCIDNVNVTAWDISENALKIAEKNNKLNQTKVIFEQQNILELPHNHKKKYNLIVSNPPYVCLSEKQKMQKNVLDFEPQLALFVNDASPLIFYEKIAQFAKNNLIDNGILLVEINENFGNETKSCFEQYGLSDVIIINDIHNKSRIIMANKY